MRGNKGLIGAKSSPSATAAVGLFSLIDQQLEKGASSWPISGGEFAISPPVDGFSVWDLTVIGDINLTSSIEYEVTCQQTCTVVVQMWGAGGARGYEYSQTPSSTSLQGDGGGGGHSNAVVNFVAGETFKFRVGQGGARATVSSTGATYLAGGIGHTDNNGGTQGGGYTGIFKNTVTQANAYLIAGGGGGGADSGVFSTGAAGGGASGQSSTAGSGQGGNGGTQSAGGTPSQYNGATAGSALLGGVGQSQSLTNASQGGGGGGYYGGGGGNVGGGGGGSGYFTANTTILVGRTLAGSGSTPAVAALANTAGAGGSASQGNTGANGRIIIEKVKPSSIYLDGTGDYITFPATGDFARDAFFGSGKTFTVEAWIYPTSLVTEAGYVSMILGDGNPTGAETFWTVSLNHDKKPHFFWYDGNVNSRYINTALTLNVWTHLAWVASAGSMSIYVNGVSQALLGSPTTLTNTGGSGTFGTMEIGVDRGRTWAGYISNLRAVRGTALYTSNFTVPTTPLTAVAGTGLLLATNQLSSLDWSPNKYALTFAGNATTTRTVVPF